MVYMYHSFLIHLSADGHLGCFHVLAIINSADASALKTEVGTLKLEESLYNSFVLSRKIWGGVSVQGMKSVYSIKTFKDLWNV